MASVYNEINPLATQIANLAHQGLTDKQIGEKIGFSFRTVYRYRHGNGIRAGRYQKGGKSQKKLSRENVSKQVYKFLPLNKLV